MHTVHDDLLSAIKANSIDRINDLIYETDAQIIITPAMLLEAAKNSSAAVLEILARNADVATINTYIKVDGEPISALGQAAASNIEPVEKIRVLINYGADLIADPTPDADSESTLNSGSRTVASMEEFISPLRMAAITGNMQALKAMLQIALVREDTADVRDHLDLDFYQPTINPNDKYYGVPVNVLYLVITHKLSDDPLRTNDPELIIDIVRLMHRLGCKSFDAIIYDRPLFAFALLLNNLDIARIFAEALLRSIKNKYTLPFYEDRDNVRCTENILVVAALDCADPRILRLLLNTLLLQQIRESLTQAVNPQAQNLLIVIINANNIDPQTKYQKIKCLFTVPVPPAEIADLTAPTGQYEKLIDPKSTDMHRKTA